MRGDVRLDVGPGRATRRVRARAVAVDAHAPRLVERRPERDALVGEELEARARVRLEPRRARRAEPSAPRLERRRQVPVVQRDAGADAALSEQREQPSVEGESLGGGGSRRVAVGPQPRPRDREPVRAQAHAGHELDVLLEAVVVVARDVAVVAVGGAARGGEVVPDARAPRRAAALDLKRRRGAPQRNLWGRMFQHVIMARL